MGKVTPDQIILALDVDTAEEALAWARRLKGRVGTCKVGLQLFLRDGPKVLRGLSEAGMPVFLDLKFHDIPNTVAQAVKSVAIWKPRLLTLHASGGREMMEAAREQAPKETCLLGVTVLTSLSESSVQEIGWGGGVQASVERLSALAKLAGLGGVVCSPHEAKGERERWGIGEVVTPGVRPPGADKGDQNRVMTPAEAIQAGASRIVLGRPVLQAKQPEALLDQILGG
jgi:orotidine-5'-phosphate decarboxylase